MADRICWNCGAIEDWEYEGDFTHRCNSCKELERDVRCRKCLRPLFLSAAEVAFRCPFCGKKNRIVPGTL